jgi:2-oxoglutarate ferredoxin oxidoreductase subunit beta
LTIYKQNKDPLFKRNIDLNKLEGFINSMRWEVILWHWKLET